MVVLSVDPDILEIKFESDLIEPRDLQSKGSDWQKIGKIFP